MYTIEIYRAPLAFTNQWNDFRGHDWTSMVRGTFATAIEACQRASEILPHGAPFTVKPIDAPDAPDNTRVVQLTLTIACDDASERPAHERIQALCDRGTLRDALDAAGIELCAAVATAL